MNDLAEQFALRDRFRRKMVMRETPAERVAAMIRLQERSWNLLRSSPEGWSRFLRRNFKKRAISPKPEYGS